MNKRYDISKWDVSNVTDMRCMFNGVTSFNQPIGAWNTHNVTDMHKMLQGGCPVEQSPHRWFWYQ
jgi:surface protein